jgi:hypothetical protein
MNYLPRSLVVAALVGLTTLTSLAASPGPSGVLGRPAVLEAKSTAVAAGAVFVDAAKGDDAQDGSEARP